MENLVKFDEIPILNLIEKLGLSFAFGTMLGTLLYILEAVYILLTVHINLNNEFGGVILFISNTLIFWYIVYHLFMKEEKCNLQTQI